MEIRRLVGLCHQQPLLTKRRKQLRLPYAGVEIAGLAVADPVPIRLREGKIEMVQRPGGWDMRWAREQLEDLARFTPLQIKQGWPRSDPWFHRLQLFALDHQRFDSKRRLVQRAKVGRLGGNAPPRINTAPHDEIPKGPCLMVHRHDAQRAPVVGQPRRSRLFIAEAVASRQRQRVDIKLPLRQLPHMFSDLNNLGPLGASPTLHKVDQKLFFD